MLHSTYVVEYDEPSFTHSFPFPTIYQFPPFFTRQLSERTWHAQLVNWNSLILAYCRYYRIYTLDLSRTSSKLQQLPTLTQKPRGEIDGELFWNRKINRALQTETIKAVFEYMVMHGDAVWLDQPTPNKNKAPIDEFDDLDQQSEQFELVFRNFPSILSTANNNNSTNASSSARSCILVYWRQPQEWASLISEWVCFSVVFVSFSVLFIPFIPFYTFHTFSYLFIPFSYLSIPFHRFSYPFLSYN